MNKERIEIRAKAKLEDCLAKSSYITPEFSSNDKSPSWDGFIRLYNKQDSSKKENLERRIPVQIKGHFAESPYNTEISFQIEISDLYNYMKECGAIFFVIYIDEKENYKIYYETLTRLKIRRIIKGKEKQESISIRLGSFPSDNISEITEIFFNFAKDMSMAFPAKDITMDDVFKKKIPGFDSFNLSYSGVAYKDDPWEYFLTHPTTLALQNSTLGIKIPIDTIFITNILYKQDESISIDGKEYYSSYVLNRKGAKCFTMNIGKSFSLDFYFDDKGTDVKFHYGIKGNLVERILDIQFLIALVQKQEITVGTQVLKFPLEPNEKKLLDIQYFENNLRLLEYIQKLFEKLKVRTIIDYDTVSESEEKALISLVNTVLLGATCVPDQKDVLYKLQIANINILLAPDKIDDNNYHIVNYFSAENKIECFFSYKNNKRCFPVPRCFILNTDDFCSLDNIDYDMVYYDIVSSQTSDELKEYTYYFIKEMVAGFLKRTKEKDLFRECIKKSLQWLKTNVPEYDYTSMEKQIT